MKLSIIIPIYNVEKYIVECANSLRLLYNDNEVEILFINDGTKDNSIVLLENEICAAMNCRIITQENKGLSAARNTGIIHSTGEYLYFMDSDDYIDSGLFYTLFNSGYSTRPDIIVGDFKRIDEDGNEIIDQFSDKSLHCSFDTKRSYEFYIQNQRTLTSVVWRSIFKRDLLNSNKLSFHEGCVYEDIEWTPIAYYWAKSIHYEPIPFYFYRKRGNSIMTDVSKITKTARDSTIIGCSLIRFGNNLPIRKEKLQFYSSGIFPLLNILRSNAKDIVGGYKQYIISLMQTMSCKFNIYYFILMFVYIAPRWLLLLAFSCSKVYKIFKD